MKSELAPIELKQLLHALKKIIKLRGLTYSKLARKLSVSEVTMKRFFASSDVSLSRLIQICDVLGLSFSDLVQQSQEQSEKVFALSRPQEQFFADHPHYFAFFMEILSEDESVAQLAKRTKLSVTSIRKYLKKLEEMKLLDRLEGDEFRLKFQGTLNWITKGPLQKKFLESDNQDFVRFVGANFEKDRHFLTTADRLIHSDTYGALLADMKSLVSHYRKRAYRDQQFFPKNELMQVKWLMGAAPYERSWRGLLEEI